MAAVKEFWGEYVYVVFTKVAPFNEAMAAACGTVGRYNRMPVPVVVKFAFAMYQDVFMWRLDYFPSFLH